MLHAFDLIEHDGDDLPLIERKRRLAKLLGKAKRRSIRFTEHLTGDGPTVFEHVCRMGLEGIVSKKVDAPNSSGPSKTWLRSGAPRERGGLAITPHPAPLDMADASVDTGARYRTEILRLGRAHENGSCLPCQPMPSSDTVRASYAVVAV